MKINIKNISCLATDDKGRAELDSLTQSLLTEKVVAIQKQFKEEASDYGTLVTNLRAWSKCHEQKDIIDDVIAVAKKIREEIKPEAFVTIGIGGSDLGGRTLHACLHHSQHNLLSSEDRGGAPEIYFTGDTFDPYELYDILDTLEKRGLILKTVYNVISKSGTTSETIAAFLVIKDKIQQKLKEAGRDAAEYANYVVATTGMNDKSTLFQLNEKQPVKFLGMLPVPDGVGGRYSFASPVGMLFLAVSTDLRKETIEARIADAVKGLADAEADMYSDPTSENNIAAQIAVVNYLAEQKGRGNIVFYPYAKTLKLVGDWFTQLSTESLQENGQGQNIIPTCGPTGNHSILNGIINGPHDKIVLFIKVDEYDSVKNYTIPTGSGIGGGLEVLEGKKFGFIQNASQLGTEINFTESNVPNVTVSIPKIDTYTICKLLYALECSVAFEGELRGLHKLTYEQSGVEGYKKATREVLSR